MTAVTQPQLHHLAITVTDLEASVRWYEAVFDVHPVQDAPHPGGVGRILTGDELGRARRRPAAAILPGE
jgi:glyoxylase I family protein